MRKSDETIAQAAVGPHRLRAGAAHLLRRLALGALSIAAASAHAAVVNVDTATSYDSFAEAYSAADNGETLELDDGTYALSSFALNKEVDIRAKNIGGAVIQGDGIATGFPVIITADMTLSGLQFTAATAAFSLRDQAVTVTVEDAVFHGMNHGVTHQNQAGGTIGQIIVNRATFYDLVEEAIYVNSGGPVVVNHAVFVDLPGLGLLLGDNEGANTLQVNNYALANTPNAVNDASLATLSGLISGMPVLADPANGYFALVEGSAGAAEGLGINLPSAARVTVSLRGNDNSVDNGATATSALNLTDFGTMHVSESGIHLFTIKNEGFADDLSLVPFMGDIVRVSGGDDDQFSVLSQPGTETLAPQSSTSFELIYSPIAVGEHQTDIVFNNDVENPFVFRVTGVATNTNPLAADDTASLDEDGSTTISVLTNDTDADGDDLVVDSATLISGQGSVSHQPSSVEYVPAADFHGAASIRYEASDGHASDSATIEVTVNPINDAPVANTDAISTDEDTAVRIDVLANDTDVDGDELSLLSVAVVSGEGSAVLDAGEVLFTPAADSTESVVLEYDVNDGLVSVIGTVNVTVNSQNDPPFAANDSATTDEDTPVQIDVLANDTDADGDALSINTATVESGGGSVAVSGGVLDFTPAANSNAPVTLSYTVSDGELSDVGSVSVSITPINDAPVATADSATTSEDTLVIIDVLANDTDVDGDALIISNASVDSGGGSVVIEGGALEYRPAADFVGTAILQYEVSDGELSDTGRVTVTVSEQNDPPVASDDSATTAEDTVVQIDVLANDSDADGDVLSISSAIVVSGGGTVVVSADFLEFTPAADSTDAVALSYTVSDGVATASASVTVTITPVNDAPDAVADSAETNEDIAVQIDVLANDTDVDGDALSISSVRVVSGGGSVEIVAGALEYTPAENSTDGATLSYVVSDGELSDTGSVSISVTPVNDPPAAADDNAITDEDTPVSIDVLANDRDVDGDALSISSASVVTGGGSVVVTAGLLEFTPATNSADPVTLTYTVSDGALSDTGRVSVSITAVNDAPIANNDSATTDEDTLAVIDVLANDSDVDGDALSISNASVVAGGGSVVVTAGLLEFTPASNSVDPVTLSYTVSDGVLNNTGSVSISITAVNDAPVASDDSVTVDEDTVVVIDVLANDSDVDGDALSVDSASVVRGDGSVVVNGGLLEFTPASNSTDPVTLSYTVSDGALSDAGSVLVTINPVNDAPQAEADSAATDEDTPILIDVLANDSDAEGDALDLIGVNVESGGGSARISGGLVEFSPAANSTQTASLRYEVSDGAASSSATIEVTVNPINDAPVANADTASTEEDTPVRIDVLANDSDVDGDLLNLLSATVVSGEGSAVVESGEVLFTPAANSSESVLLEYDIGDGQANAIGTVHINIIPINDTPAAVDDRATTDEDTPISIDVLANDSDVDGDALTLLGAAVISGGGSASIEDGLVRFTPAADSTAPVTLAYTVSDGQASATGGVAVSITPVNDAPIALADVASAAEDQPLDIDALANDTDPEGDVLSLASVRVIRGDGAAAIVAGRVRYTPAADSHQDAALSYVVSDGELIAAAEITITVSPVNDAPVARADAAALEEDTSTLIDVLANDSDVDGDALSILSADFVDGDGSVVVEANQLRFTPAADSTAPVALEYAITDGHANAIGSVTVTITAVNDAPVANPDTASGHFADTLIIDVLANDRDVDGDALSLIAASSAHGRAELVDGLLQFQADAWRPQAEIEYTLSDGVAHASGSVLVALNEYREPLVIGTGEIGAANGSLSDAALSDLYSVVVGNSGQLFAATGSAIRAVNIEQDRVFGVIDNEPGHLDGHKEQARFGVIEGLVYDPDNGYLYISEVSKGTIRRFDLRRDTVNTIRRGLAQPIGLALSNDRNTLYVIEHGKARVLSLSLLRGEDSVLVGSGSRGFADGVGENAQIDVSVGLTVGPDGTVFLADRGNGRVRAIDPATREIRTLSQDFEAPSDVAVRDSNTLLVLDRGANLIKRLDLTSLEASVLPASEGELHLPVAMSIDLDGTLYVADSGNNQIKAFSAGPLERTHSAFITGEQALAGDTQQGSYAIRDLVGTGEPGVVSGRADLANLFDPDQVLIAGENILFNSSRQFTLLRTDLNTGESTALFPDFAGGTLVDATAYGVGVSRWGHIDGMAYWAEENRLFVFAGRNTLFNIDLDDNSFQHVTTSGLVTGGDFTIAADGSLYMADTGANLVVELDPNTGAVVQAFESNNGVALSGPTDLDFDGNGELYIANWGERNVVKLNPSTGELSPYIAAGGFSDGTLDTATVAGVYGVEMGDDGVLYLADRLNHAIRRVDTRADTPRLETIAGDGVSGVISDSGARFNNPTSLAVSKNGAVVVTDDGNHRVRLIATDASLPLIPFDTTRDLLDTNPDGSPVVEGTLPLGEFPIVRNNSILQAAVAPLPMLLVDADEREQTQGGVNYNSLEGEVSLQVPVGLNGEAFSVHGAQLLVLSTREGAGEELETNNAFFIKVSMRRFTLSWLAELDQFSNATSNELRELVSLLPDVQMLIAYSDKNLDAQAINTLPQNLQDFFAGILDPQFGVPIFNGNGSINAFLIADFDSLPTALTQALSELGVDRDFISHELGVSGGLLQSIAVDNIGFLIDALLVLFPSLQEDVIKDASDFSIPAASAGLILPGLSLPAFMQSAVSDHPFFQIVGFEPDPAIQLRYFLSISPNLGAGAAIDASAGVEGALRVNMPNILNANSLNDAPGTDPLDVRVNLTASLTVAAGVSDRSLGIASADVGIQGSMQLVNYWNNPLGIQGIGFGDASFLIGAQGAAGAALTNAGVGVDVFGGLSGNMACIDESNEIIGFLGAASAFFGFKVGVPPLPTGVGIAGSVASGMSFYDGIRCRLKVYNSIVLGMGDSLLAALPDGPERDVVQAIQDIGATSFDELENIILAPLELAPIRHLLDGIRFAGDFSLATPGVALPNRFGSTGLESLGRIEVRDSVDAPWVEIADASIVVTFAKGLTADFGLADYNVADLIVMDNVVGQLSVPLHNLPSSNLSLTGSQKFFDLQSDTTIAMSIRDGVTIDSLTSIAALGEVSIFGESTGQIDNWPPLGPGGGIDFSGEARFDLDTNPVADEIHGAVNSVLNGANSAYREALNVLGKRSRDEQDLQRRISDLESDIRRRTDEINNRLRPGFDDAQRRLSNARRHVSNVWSDIRYYEGRKRYHDGRCAWWRAWECGAAAYWWGREKFARGLVWTANRAIDVASAAVRGAENALNSALYDVTRTLSPRLNAYRVAIVGLRTARDLAAIAVRSLQAANSQVQSIGNALRDAGNVKVHDASASIDSLFNVLAGTEGLRTNLDIEVLDLRCRSSVDVNLQRIVDTLLSGINGIQRACIGDLHENANSQRKVAMQKAYFANRAQGLAFSAEPAVNNDADSATVLDGALPIQRSADNSGADTAQGEFASELTSHTLWWRLQPAGSGVYRIAASSELTDTTLQIHRAVDGAPNAETLIAADFIPANSAELNLQLDGGQPLLIGVGSQLGLPGAFTLRIDAQHDLPLAANDAFADAIAVTGLGGSVEQNNLSATVEEGEHAGDELPLHATLWWRLDVTTSGLYTINTLGSTVDTVLRAYRLDGGGVVSVENLLWQKTSDQISVDPRSELTIFAEAGERLWFSAGSRFPNGGRIAFNWQHSARDSAQLQGDNFAQPIVLDGVSSGVVRSNLGATSESGEPLHAGVSRAASLWYRYVAPDTSNYLFETTGSAIDSALALYTGESLDSLEVLASSDGQRAGDGLLNRVRYSGFRVNLQAGETYYLAQAGLEEAEGDVVLTVARFSLNDRFEAPIDLPAAGGQYSPELSEAQLQGGEPDYAEILAREFLPEVVLASLSELAASAGDAGVELTVDDDLVDTLSALHEGALADLRARPVRHSLWYRYSATQAGDLQLNTVGSEPDTALVVFVGDDLGTLQPLVWHDDLDNGTDSHLRLAVEAGQTYTIALLARSAGVVRFSAALVPVEQQTVANDEPDSALLLNSAAGSQSADNTYASANPELEAVLSQQDGQRLWWRFDAPEAGYLTIDTEGSSSDTVIEAYRANFGTLALISLNDNFHPDLNSSRLRIAVQAGHSYWVAVDTLSGGAGPLTLNHRFEREAALPVNDRIAQASVIATDTYSTTASNAYAQHQADEPFIGSVLRPNSVWYQWTPSSSGLASLSTLGSAFDTVLGVYLGGAEGDLQLLQSNDDAGADELSSLVQVHVVEGVSYLIAIAGKRDVQGIYSLSLSVVDDGAGQAANTQSTSAAELSGSAPQLSTELRHVLPQTDTGSALVEASGQEASSRWWQWLAPTDGLLEVSTAGSAVVPQLELYQGDSAQSIVLLDADKGAGDDSAFSRVRATVRAGQRYFIRVSSPFSAQGALELSLTYLPASDARDTQDLPVNSGSVAAAIVAAGTRAWQWTATDTGVVQFSLSRGTPQNHRIRVYALADGTAVEIDYTPPMTTEETLPAFQFVSERGARYRIEVHSAQALLGNAELHYSYLNRQRVDITSDAGQALLAKLRPLLTLRADGQGGFSPALAASDATVAGLMTELLDGSGIRAEQLRFEVSISRAPNGVSSLAEVDKLRFVARDQISGEILISAVFDLDVGAGTVEQHQQVLVDRPSFTELNFVNGAGGLDTVALQLGASAFNQAVAQAFVSVEQVELGNRPASDGQHLLHGSTLYPLQLDLYDSSGQRYPLEHDSSVLRSVPVRLPIDVDVLLAWLGLGAGELDEAQRLIDLAVDQGVLGLVRAASVEALLAGNSSAVNGDLRVDLQAGRVEFTTDHFSVFSLAAVRSADAIDTREPVATSISTGAVSPGILLCLLLMLGLRGRRAADPHGRAGRCS